jgi:two-component system, NtrC family, sensor kinase
MTDRTCLIVDDEPAIRSFLRTILERRQIQVLEAGNATEALRTLQKRGVDLVLSDVIMPGDVSGLDLAHCVRHSFPSVPVILFSGYCEDAKEAAAFEFVKKPFSPETILNAVERALIRRAAATAHGGAHE